MSSIEKTLTKRVEDYFASLKIQPGTAILVGVSGGPDSVALLSLLSGLQFHLFCGYVDHGMRPAVERASDRSFVESFCSGLSVPFLSRSIPERSIESKASKSGRSTEDVARELRYSLLEQMRREAKASCIAVGHNRDDQFETMIMRFFMGSGPEGLKGIPKCRGNIIRPLLRVSRAEILAYLEEHGISYRTDSTNLESMYLRNKIRLTLIPEVRRIFPGYGRALESLSEKMACIEDFLKYTTRLHGGWERTEDGFRIAQEEYLSLHPAERYESLYQLFDNEEGNREIRIPYRFLRPAIFLRPAKGSAGLEKPAEEDYGSSSRECMQEIPDGVILRGYGFIFRKKGNFFWWQKDIVLEGKKRYLRVIMETNTVLPDTGVVRVSYEGPPSESGIVFFGERVVEPILIRSRMPGDEIRTAFGAKSLKKLMSEWGVSEGARLNIPILEDRSGIIGVWGKPFGYANAVAAIHQHADTIYKSSKSTKLMFFSLTKNGE